LHVNAGCATTSPFVLFRQRNEAFSNPTQYIYKEAILDMKNRVKNVGLENRQPFLNSAVSAKLRADIDAVIDHQIENWYDRTVRRPTGG
jgi:hypothetical protein